MGRPFKNYNQDMAAIQANSPRIGDYVYVKHCLLRTDGWRNRTTIPYIRTKLSEHRSFRVTDIGPYDSANYRAVTLDNITEPIDIGWLRKVSDGPRMGDA